MKRSKRPEPITIPTPAEACLVDQDGVYSEDGVVIGRGGCVIACGCEPQLPASCRSDHPLSRGLAEPPERSSGSPSTSQQGSSSPQQISLNDLDELQVVGRGSSGLVKAVRHRGTGQVFVLKAIQFDASNELLRKQVMQELKALHGGRHPNVVQYCGAFFVGGAITILMDYMAGGTLADLLAQRRTSLSEPHLAELARQVLAGLAHLHGRLRIVHRDIKPSNLLLSAAGQLCISDFGVSGQLSASMSKCVSWVGTVTYMSPERIRGDRYSFNTDVWSLGLLLVEAALGHYPYPPSSEAAAAAPLGFWELLEYIVVQPPPQLPNSFSSGFRSFIVACLQKDPAQRAPAKQLLHHPWLMQHHPPGGVRLAELLSDHGTNRAAAAPEASASRNPLRNPTSQPAMDGRDGGGSGRDQAAAGGPLTAAAAKRAAAPHAPHATGPLRAGMQHTAAGACSAHTHERHVPLQQLSNAGSSGCADAGDRVQRPPMACSAGRGAGPARRPSALEATADLCILATGSAIARDNAECPLSVALARAGRSGGGGSSA